MSEDRPLHVRVAEALGWKPQPKPTIAELEEILAHNPKPTIEIMPSGEVRAVPRYDTDWSATGPLIEKYGIDLFGPRYPADTWCAWLIVGEGEGHGSTPLIAVCNLLLALAAAGKLEQEK